MPVISHGAASSRTYDAVVVGSGVARSVVANEPSRQGFQVPALEAGAANDTTIHDERRARRRRGEPIGNLDEI